VAGGYDVRFHLLRDTDGDGLEDRVAGGLTGVVQKADIDESLPLSVSLMPTGIDKLLSWKELRGLMTYLLSDPSTSPQCPSSRGLADNEYPLFARSFWLFRNSTLLAMPGILAIAAYLHILLRTRVGTCDYF